MDAFESAALVLGWRLAGGKGAAADLDGSVAAVRENLVSSRALGPADAPGRMLCGAGVHGQGQGFDGERTQW